MSAFLFSKLLLLAGLLSAPPAITIDLGSLADWVSGLGSMAAVIVAVVSIRSIERHRRDDQRAEQLALAFELAGVVADLGASLADHHDHFVRNLRHFTAVDEKGTVILEYDMIGGPAGISDADPVCIPKGTTQLLVKAGASELDGKLRLLISRERSLTAALRDYRHFWELAMAKMPVPESFKDGLSIGSIDIHSTEFGLMKVELIRLSGLVQAIGTISKEASDLAAEICEKIGPVLKEHFQLPAFSLEIETVSAEPANPPTD